MTSMHLQVRELGFSDSELQRQCNVTFAGDSDIDGYGMLISSMTFALLTCIFALLNAWAERDIGPSLESWIHAQRPKCRDRGSTSIATSSSRRWCYSFSSKMLSSMCDLQLITGLGIMAATFFGLETYSLFHLNLINSYYWLSITGLWVVGSLSSYDGSRVSAHKHKPGQDLGKFECFLFWLSRRDILQKLLIVPSVVLGVIMQVILFRKVTKEWDYQTSGRCFRDDDRSSWQSTWVWVVGLCLYDFGVLLSFHPTTASTRTYLERMLSTQERRCVSTMRNLLNREILPLSRRGSQYTLIMSSSTQPTPPSTLITSYEITVCQGLSTTVQSLTALVLLVALWSLRQTLALCALADGTPVFVAIYCMSFFSWSAYDIIGNRILNRSLITDNTTWGFGQVLPLVLMLAVVFNMVDAIKFANDKQAERRPLAEAQKWPSRNTEVSDDEAGSDRGQFHGEKQSLRPLSLGGNLSGVERALLLKNRQSIGR